MLWDIVDFDYWDNGQGAFTQTNVWYNDQMSDIMDVSELETIYLRLILKGGYANTAVLDHYFLADDLFIYGILC